MPRNDRVKSESALKLAWLVQALADMKTQHAEELAHLQAEVDKAMELDDELNGRP